VRFGKAVIAQGGGPTAVINQSLAGAVRALLRSNSVDAVYGAVHGVKGIANEQFLNLSSCSMANLDLVAQTPGSALGSTRDKPDSSYCEQMFDVLRAHDVRHFYYIGGNDSADTCRIIAEQAQTEKYELRVVHIPKTVDNDLLMNDHTPGYGSAAKFVSYAFAGADMDNRSLPGIYLGVVMGRDAGFLTAASSLHCSAHSESPLLVYVPEFSFDTDRFLSQIESTYSKFGRCLVAVSEGIRAVDGEPILAKLSSKLDQDPHGNFQLSGNGQLADSLAELIKKQIKTKVRADTFGYIQRSFPGAVSAVDAREAFEVAESAVRFSFDPQFQAGSATITRTSDYAVQYGITSLESVARATKFLSADMYDMESAKMTDVFLRYAKPLVDELPHCTLLTGEPVTKILRKKSDH